MTFSIVARDPVDGTLGIGSQSHFFAVGSVVGRAEAGVGAVVSQAFANVDWPHEGLALLRAGATSQQVVEALTQADQMARFRQLAVMDATGETAAFTGESCVPSTGVAVGDGVIAVGNMLANDGVCDEMIRVFVSSGAGLAGRLLAGLAAGERAGGDARGSQSAFMQIVDDVRDDRPWRHVLLDIRVDDHQDPVGELARQMPIHDAFATIGTALFAPPMVIGDIGDGLDPADVAVMTAALAGASRVLGANREAELWRAVILDRSDDVDGARQAMADLIDNCPELSPFISGLAQVGIIGRSPDGAW